MVERSDGQQGGGVRSHTSALTAEKILKMMADTMLRYRGGEISDKTAYREAYLCQTLLKGVETTDLEERLSILEEALSERR